MSGSKQTAGAQSSNERSAVSSSTWKATVLGLAVLAVFFVFGTAAVQAAPGSAWAYKDGDGNFYETNSPGQWVEQTHLGTVYTFTEVRRTPEYVELYDGSRDLSIRLYDGACYIRHAGTGGRFDLLYRGYWTR